MQHVYFKSSIRKHPETGILSGYYRLVESYRNGDNRICHRTILNIGFIEDATPEQLNIIQKRLTDKYERKESFFQHEEDPVIKKYVEQFWQRIVDSKKIDIASVEKLTRMINADTMRHSNVREIGSEWSAIIPGISWNLRHCFYQRDLQKNKQNWLPHKLSAVLFILLQN